MKPTLWRCRAYSLPGLPRPTKSFMASPAAAARLSSHAAPTSWQRAWPPASRRLPPCRPAPWQRRLPCRRRALASPPRPQRRRAFGAGAAPSAAAASAPALASSSIAVAGNGRHREVAVGMVGRTPSGILTAEMWIERPISRPSRLNSKYSGMASAGQITSTSWRTMLSTPPRLRPGDSASLMNRTGTLTRMRAAGADALEVDVDGQVLDRIELHLARDHAALLAVDVEVEHGRQELAAPDQLGQLA